MSILLDLKFDAPNIKQAFVKALPGKTIIERARDKDADLSDVRYAVVWKAERGILARLPKLEVIFSGGAGVDHVFSDPDLPDSIPIARFVDPDLTGRMSEWVVLQCLMHLRQQRAYDEAQRHRKWLPLPQKVASDIRVGLMGLGALGLDAALKLKIMGFKVHGWSRSLKSIEGIETFAGPDGMDEFLGQSDMLVSLLPLTPETSGMINRTLLKKLSRKGAIRPVLINAGRGGSQIDADIVGCLQDGTLGGVSLDVFEREPLDENSPLWDFDNAILTPHVAAESSIPALARHVASQIARYENGKSLDNLVDGKRGY